MTTELAGAMSTESDDAGAARRPGRARFISVPLVRPAPLRQGVYEALVELIINLSVLPRKHREVDDQLDQGFVDALAKRRGPDERNGDETGATGSTSGPSVIRLGTHRAS